MGGSGVSTGCVNCCRKISEAMASGSKKDASELFKVRAPGWCGHGKNEFTILIRRSSSPGQRGFRNHSQIASKTQVLEIWFLCSSGWTFNCLQRLWVSWGIWKLESCPLAWIYWTFVCLSKWLLHHFVNVSGNVVWFFWIPQAYPS